MVCLSVISKDLWVIWSPICWAFVKGIVYSCGWLVGGWLMEDPGWETGKCWSPRMRGWEEKGGTTGDSWERLLPSVVVGTENSL